MRRRPARYGGRPDAVLVVVLDCADLDRSAAFWGGALGYAGPPAGAPGPYRQLSRRRGRSGAAAAAGARAEGGQEPRVHLDLRVPDLDDKVARLLALGARHTTGAPVEEDGWTWYVLADPDGNELCVLRPPS